MVESQTNLAESQTRQTPIRVLNTQAQQQITDTHQGSWCYESCLDCLDWLVHTVSLPGAFLCHLFMRVAGPAFVISFYYLMAYHTWAFLTIIATVLRRRVGTEFAVVWTLIGIVITYNVVWNHLLAMCLKPGSPKDLAVSNLSLHRDFSNSFSLL